jgi:aryl-alcohol dehydrogenase-like predicted oxidoreductase
MNYRKLGRTGLEVSAIGYGAWGIGGPPDWREKLSAHCWVRNFYD